MAYPSKQKRLKVGDFFMVFRPSRVPHVEVIAFTSDFTLTTWQLAINAKFWIIDSSISLFVKQNFALNHCCFGYRGLKRNSCPVV